VAWSLVLAITAGARLTANISIMQFKVTVIASLARIIRESQEGDVKPGVGPSGPLLPGTLLKRRTSGPRWLS
jgi:hypothetical protein